MPASTATTVQQYLSSLPADRRRAIERVRDTVNAHLPAGYAEEMQFGMIGWCIPLSRYPDTYNGKPLCYAALAAQKDKSSLYLMAVYGDKVVEAKFRAGFKAAGKKLDMGKSCVRFASADDLPLDLIGATIASVPVDKFIATYEKSRPAPKQKTPAPAKKPASKKPAKRR